MLSKIFQSKSEETCGEGKEEWEERRPYDYLSRGEVVSLSSRGPNFLRNPQTLQ